MGGGNGAKSKTKRERNATKPAKGGNTSQLGANLKAMSIICTVCKQVRFGCSIAVSCCVRAAGGLSFRWCRGVFVGVWCRPDYPVRASSAAMTPTM